MPVVTAKHFFSLSFAKSSYAGFVSCWQFLCNAQIIGDEKNVKQNVSPPISHFLRDAKCWNNFSHIFFLFSIHHYSMNSCSMWSSDYKKSTYKLNYVGKLENTHSNQQIRLFFYKLAYEVLAGAKKIAGKTALSQKVILCYDETKNNA